MMMMKKANTTTDHHRLRLVGHDDHCQDSCCIDQKLLLGREKTKEYVDDCNDDCYYYPSVSFFARTVLLCMAVVVVVVAVPLAAYSWNHLQLPQAPMQLLQLQLQQQQQQQAAANRRNLEEQQSGSDNTDTLLPEQVSNPYARGCLHTKIPSLFPKPRVCNSDDPVELHGIVCSVPPFPDEYLEIRVGSGNWVSGTALSMLTQIILSEILGVPTTSETSRFNMTRNLYDIHGRLDMVGTVNSVAVGTPSNMTLVAGGDCRPVTSIEGGFVTTEEEYYACTHFVPEFWSNDIGNWKNRLIEPPTGLGVLGEESWFITKFTLDEDPSLVSYHGLKGDSNREKMAKTFKRPVTWKDYCDEVSETKCQMPDVTAARYPKDEEEEMRMFVDGFYRGYFRYTDANNCTLFPSNCTGHVANYPCGWSSGMESNIYHMNIALDPNNGPDGAPNGYTQSQLFEMWHAANATRENLMMMWWTPEPLYEKFLNTDAEMQRVLMNPYTLDCARGRAQKFEKCDRNLTDRVGPPEASCGNPAESLSKYITSALHELTYDPDIPEAAVSPAHEALRRFRISDHQLLDLFNAWDEGPTPRDGVCNWAVSNLDHLLAHVPYSYPRSPQTNDDSVVTLVVLCLGIVATIVVLATTAIIYVNRKAQAIQFAQLDFLYLILAGSFLVCIGAVMLAVPPSDGTCMGAEWFLLVGYTLDLLPLVVKVAAINKMASAARRMRRVKINRNNLYLTVAIFTTLIVIFLSVWTAIDPSRTNKEYELTETQNSFGDTIVNVSYFCNGGDEKFWQYIGVGWNLILLLVASVLAFQSRNIVETFNESRTLAFLIYSHTLFVIVRTSLFIFEDKISGPLMNTLRSSLASIDQISSCVIYFLPKLSTQFNTGTQVSRTSFQTPQNWNDQSSVSALNQRSSRDNTEKMNTSTLNESKTQRGPFGGDDPSGVIPVIEKENSIHAKNIDAPVETEAVIVPAPTPDSETNGSMMSPDKSVDPSASVQVQNMVDTAQCAGNDDHLSSNTAAVSLESSDSTGSVKK